MIHLKINPIDADRVVDYFQQYFWGALVDFQPDWESYHRVYVNPKENNKYIPEFFLDNEYKECLISDKSVLSTFFTIDETRNQSTGVFTAAMSLYIQCSDLSALFPTITHRADEELENKFMLVYNGMVKKGAKLLKTVRGINNVYSSFERENVEYEDMNEYCVIRIDFEVQYSTMGCKIYPVVPIPPSCQDGTVNILNSADGLIKTVTVGSGQTEETYINDTAILVRNSNDDVVATQISLGGAVSADVPIPDTTYNFVLDGVTYSETLPTGADHTINIILT